jgi:hypothetical protein
VPERRDPQPKSPDAALSGLADAGVFFYATERFTIIHGLFAAGSQLPGML